MTRTAEEKELLLEAIKWYAGLIPRERSTEEIASDESILSDLLDDSAKAMVKVKSFYTNVVVPKLTTSKTEAEKDIATLDNKITSLETYIGTK